MLRITQRIERPDADSEVSTSLTLPLDQRLKARLRVILDNGQDAGLFLDRGPILRGGSFLRAEDGSIIRVEAAAEPVSVIRTGNGHLLSRACYHLGNRHAPLQILNGEVRYQHDHVLDDMMRGLGLEPQYAELPFEPEPGAYGEHESGHAHGHSHSHGKIHRSRS